MSDKLVEEAITEWLHEWLESDLAMSDRLLNAVYHELRRIAKQEISREHVGRSLGVTDLINEMYVRLCDQKKIEIKDRNHFLAICSRLMRQIMMERARRRNAIKRGGNAHESEMPIEGVADTRAGREMEALNLSIEKLMTLHPRAAKVLEIRYFGGYTVMETADILNIAPMTVKRDWQIARNFMKDQLEEMDE